METVLVTGSAGLIGSESVKFFGNLGFRVIGIDNNMRQYFFGEEASTDWNRQLLQDQFKNYTHHQVDIRDQLKIKEIFSQHRFDLIIHAAAQPSHDWAAKEPLTDFSINATGTLNLLEAYRQHSPEAVFIFTSTNKVYGDTPNLLPLKELETRYEIDSSHQFKKGIDESMTLDNSKHSIFGVSKVAADIMVQEYGKYFNLHTAVFRGGCLTGPSHSATKLHGFLAYLIKCIAEDIPYTIFGYNGKQVRDNIHSHDLVSAFYEVYKKPRIGEAYNIGGSRFSNISMMEAIEKTESYLGRKGNINYTEKNRAGDHIWYISDVSKFQSHYPDWRYQYGIDAIIEEICQQGHFSKPKIIGGSLISQLKVGGKGQVFVAAHVTEMYGPVQALKAYLIKNIPKFLFIEHPFTYTSLTTSHASSFRGSLLSTTNTIKKVNIEIFAYLKDFLLTIYWFIKQGKDSKIFIGINNLNTLAGVILKALGFKFTLIYYATDYTLHRFQNPAINWIYQAIDRLCVRQADFIWSTNVRAQKARNKYGVDENKSLLVTTGVYLDKIQIDKVIDKDKNTLVIVEHLTEDKGLQLAIKAFPRIRKMNKQAKLVIIGTGPYKNDLTKLVHKLNLNKYIEFKESLRPDVYLNDLPNYGIGLDIYRGDSESLAYYAEPPTPKECLASGLPIIVTKNLALAEQVENRKLGIAIAYNQESLLAALKKLWSDKIFYSQCAKNAIKYTRNLSWQYIFDQAFAKTKN